MKLTRIGNYLCMFLFYLIRPLLGPAICRFSFSCGNYAIKQLQDKPLLTALYAIAKRVGACHPWGSITE